MRAQCALIVVGTGVRRAWLVLACLLACGPARVRTPEVPMETRWPANATSGVTDPGLARLLGEQWAYTLERSPTFATELGDHRFDDRLEDVGPEALERDRRMRAQWIVLAEGIAEADLNEADRLSVELFLWQRRMDEATDRCRGETWQFGPTSNPISGTSYLPELHTVTTPQDGANLLARYRAIPKLVDQTIANLRVGLAEGRVATAHSTRLSIDMADRELAKPLAEWPLLAPAAKDHPDWPAGELDAYRSELGAVVEGDVKAAFTRWRDFLRDEVLPVARPDEKSGLVWLPGGEACYRAAIEYHTTLPKTADEVHQTGLDELARIHAAMAGIGERTLGTSDRAEIFARLRSDAALHFGSADEIEQKAQSSLARAREAIPRWFGRLPKADCVVRRIPDYEAPYTYVAYYRPPHQDGSKPGEYFVNTLAPETRPRFEAEALAFHESIPGHHLQIAIAQELPDTPAFRRHAYTTAYAEGWALYTEVLADEMGLYSGDLDRLGQLSFDSWRAARLVVDTGIHAKGWSREQAVQFMLENTPLAENNIRNEVDRYVNWPGQALGYKIGQLEMLALRREAEARHGDRFDIRGFHDVVLTGGPMTLPLLRARVEAWAP
jgi:uncharacterized protein (DUF885 family)